jgi:hypothetical protein
VSAFETKLYALCVEEAARTHGVAESATLTHIMTAALATMIAALAVEGLPEMVARRAHLFRHPDQGRPQ